MARTQEEHQAKEADENERTTATGLFHFAVSHNSAADRLGDENPLGVTHPESPREFLFTTAIELYFKAYLRDRGKSVRELRDIGHDLDKLADEYEKAVGPLNKSDRWVIHMLALNNTSVTARYIRTGFYSQASIADVQKTAAVLRVAVGEALKSSGCIVRWYNAWADA